MPQEADWPEQVLQRESSQALQRTPSWGYPMPRPVLEVTAQGGCGQTCVSMCVHPCASGEMPVSVPWCACAGVCDAVCLCSACSSCTCIGVLMGTSSTCRYVFMCTGEWCVCVQRRRVAAGRLCRKKEGHTLRGLRAGDLGR